MSEFEVLFCAVGFEELSLEPTRICRDEVARLSLERAGLGGLRSARRPPTVPCAPSYAPPDRRKRRQSPAAPRGALAEAEARESPAAVLRP